MRGVQLQDSSGKSIKTERAAAVKNRTESAGDKLILFSALVLILLLGSCASLKDSRSAVPYGALPGDCLFYFAADPLLIPAGSPDMDRGLKSLLKRTEEITGGGKKGEFYLLFKGRYPDAFAEKKIAESDEWSKGEYGKCYYNESRNLSLYFAENNHIFVCNYINKQTGEKPLEEIYNNYRNNSHAVYTGSDAGFDYAEYFLNRKRGTVFQLYSSYGSGLISMFPEKRLESAVLKDIEVFLGKSENEDGRFSLESSMEFSSSEEAGKFSPVIKLVFLDLIRNKESGVSSSDGKRFTVAKDDSIIRISDLAVSDKVTGDFFTKIIKGQVF